MFRHVGIFGAAASAALLMAGCGGGGADTETPAPPVNPPAPAGTIIQGVASKGPLLGAAVDIFAVTNGAVGATPLATTTTNAATGAFSATVSHSGPVVVRISVVNGTTQMLDELAGTNQPAPAGLVLNAALPALASLAGPIAVTPLTQLAYRLASDNGGLTAGNIDAFNGAVGTVFLAGAQVLHTQPIALGVYATATDAQKAQAKLLTALAVAADQGTAVGPNGQPCAGSYGDKLVCLVAGLPTLVSVQGGNTTLTQASNYVADAYGSIDQGTVPVNGGQAPSGLNAPTPAQTTFVAAVPGNGGGNGGGGSTPPPGFPTLRQSEYVYAALPSANQVAVYAANPATGALTPAGSTVATGSGTAPSAVVADPARRYLYVALADSGQIARYSIHPATGVLTAQGTPLSAAAGSPVRLAVDPLGRFLFALHDNGAGDVHVTNYRIDPANGSLTAVEAPLQLSTSSFANDLVTDRTGRTLFVSSFSGLKQIVINQSTGAFGLVTTLNNVTYGLAVNGFNNRVYTSEQTIFGLMSWPFDPALGTALGNTMTPIRHRDWFSGPVTQWRLLEPDPQGRFLFAWNSTGGLIETYPVDAASGEIVLWQSHTEYAEYPVGTWAAPAGCDPRELDADGSGRFLRVSCGDGSHGVHTLAIDRATGALAALSHVTAAGDASDLETVDLGARLVFAARDDGIGVHTVDPTTGDLPEVTAVQSLSYAPAGITVNRADQRLYVARPGTGIDVFTIDAAIGTLAAAGNVPGDGEAAPVLDPAGRHVYVPNGSALSISRHGIGSGGVLVAGADYVTDEDIHPNGINVDPRALVFHPSGRYAYVAHGGSSNPGVTTFEVDAVTGELSFHSVSAVPQYFGTTGQLPTGLVIDPTGSFVYVASGSVVYAYRVQAGNGLLAITTQKINGGLALGSAVSSLAADPLGGYLYAATANGVVVLGIDRSTASSDRGALAIAGTVVAGTTGQLLVDPTGQRLYGASGTTSLASHALDRSGAAPVAGSVTTTTVDAAVSAVATTP